MSNKYPVNPCAPPDLAEVDVITVMQALADPVRVEIVRQLAGCSGGHGMTCGQIEIPVTKSTASHHFKTLLCAGITDEREDGTRKWISLRRTELDERFPGLVDLLLRD